MKKYTLFSILSLFAITLIGCGEKTEDETGGEETPEVHEHTFSDEWSKNETMHWHASTCGHDEYTKDLGEHVYDQYGNCTICGGETPTGYPVITSIVYKGQESLGNVILNNWASDFSNVTSINYDAVGTNAMFLDFDSNGKVTSEGSIEDEISITEKSYTYEGDLMTCEFFYDDGEVSSKKVYSYNEDKKLTDIKYFTVELGVETLWKEDTYEYTAEKETEISVTYKDGEIESYTESVWTITTEGENTKRTLTRKNGQEGEYKTIGYLVYNKSGQLIKTQDSTFYSQGPEFCYEDITYTDDGELRSVTTYDEGEYGYRDVYTYDDNGFLVKEESFDYNETTSEYDILTAGYDFVVDSRGTVLQTDLYHIENGQKVVVTHVEYQVAYLPVSFSINYIYYNAKTKGNYNSFELEILATLG